MKKLFIRVVKQFYRYSHRFYTYLEANEKIMLLFLLMVCLAVQIPKAYLVIEYGRLNFPGYDASLVLNGAENIKDNGKYEYSTLFRFDEYDGLDRHEIRKPAYFYPPFTSLMLSGVLLIHNSLFATEVFQFIIFMFVVIVYFKLITEWFNQKTAFFSSILVILNPLIYIEIFSPVRTHILSLLLTLLFFLVLTNKKYFKNIDVAMIFLGLICVLSYLTRDINLVLFMLLSFYFLYKKKIRKLLFFTTTFIALVLPWWIRNFSYYGTINPRSKIVQYDYPPAYEINTGLELITSDNFFEITWNLFGHFLRDLPAISMFYVFFPFVIMGLLYSLSVSRKHDLVVAYCIALVFLYCGSSFLSVDGGYSEIYLIPVIVLLYPFGIYLILSADVILFSGYQNNGKNSLLTARIKLYKKIIFSTLIALTLVVSSATIAKESYDFYNYEREMSDYDSKFHWVIDNIPEGEKVAVSNCPSYLPLHLTHYTGLEAITLPQNLDAHWLERFIIDYNVSFLFIQSDDTYGCIYDESLSPYNELFSGDSNITLETISFQLIHEEEGILGNVFIYRVN